MASIIVGGLPAEYRELHYIMANGTQRVDTGIIPSSTTRLFVDADVLSANSGTNHHIASVYSNSNYFTLRLRADLSGFAARVGSGALTNVAHEGTVYGRHTFDFNQGTIQIDNAEATELLDSSSIWNETLSLNLFCYRGGESSFNGYSYIKLYSCKIYDGFNLVRNFIPCMNMTTFEVGLYDTCEREFHGNSGTSVLFPGPPVIKLPGGFSELESIISTGTQYIDTEFKVNQDTTVVAAFKMTANASNHQMMFGSRNTTSTGQYILGFAGHKSPAVWRSDFGTSQVSFESTLGYADRILAIKKKNVCTLNGTSVTNTAATFESSYNMILMGGNSAGSVSSLLSTEFNMCLIYDGDDLVRDFVSCKSKDGTIGLYDQVEGKMYTNAGSGDFTAGSVTYVSPEGGLFVKVNGHWKSVDSITVNAKMSSLLG